MGDIPIDGKTRVAYVASISNINLPTTTELNAGLLISPVMRADGLIGFEPDTADVDTSSIESTFDTVTIGRDSFSGTMVRLKKQSGTDTVYDTLTRGTEGYIVIRRYVVAATAWASAQKVNVYPVIFGSAKELPPDKNAVGMYEVPCKVSYEPSLRAAVA